MEVQTAKQHRRHYEEKKRDLMKGIAELVKAAEKEDKEVEVSPVTALLWQKEASDKRDISCERAKCVCHFH